MVREVWLIEDFGDPESWKKMEEGGREEGEGETLSYRGFTRGGLSITVFTFDDTD